MLERESCFAISIRGNWSYPSLGKKSGFRMSIRNSPCNADDGVTDMRRITSTALLLIGWGAFCLFSQLGAMEEPGRSKPEVEILPMTKGWTFLWSDISSGFQWGTGSHLDGRPPDNAPWEPCNLEQPIHPTKGRLLWLKRTLDEPNIPRASLFIPQYGCFQAFEVYLDEARIYTSGELYPAFVNRHLYIKWHLIPLPCDYHHRILTFRFFSNHPKYIGFIAPVSLGDGSSILRLMVMPDLDITVLGLLMIICGLLAAALLIAYYKLRNHPLLFFSIMAVSAGLYIQTESNITSLLLDRPVLQSYGHYVSFFVFTGGAWAFLGQILGGRWKRFYQGGCLFQLAYLAAALALDFLDILSWDLTFEAGMALLGVCIVAVELELFKTAVAGSREARILSAGYGALGLSGTWDILAGLKIVNAGRVVFPLGLIVLLTCLAIFLLLRYRAERREVEARIARSEERFRSLFDNAPISILEVDFRQLEPMVICTNIASENVFALDRKRIPFPLGALLSPAAMAAVRRAVVSCAAVGHEIIDATAVREDDLEFPARIGLSLLPAFGMSRVVFTIEDITEEKERRSEEEAINEERHRMAREIHDGLAQDLAVMNMRASVWHRLVDDRPEQMHVEIRQFQEVLKASIGEVRRCIFALRPLDLEELGFFEATRRFLKDFGEQSRLAVTFEVAGSEQDLPHRLEPVLFRIVQEGLNNVRKHASANKVFIHLHMELIEGVRLLIHDDGKGFDTTHLEEAFREGHMGIRQMRERVVRQKGSFHIQSDGIMGTRIEVVLPSAV